MQKRQPPETIRLHVNGQAHQLELDPTAPLLYALRNDLGLKGPKYGCGLEQCGSCKVLVDGVDVPSCQLAVGHVAGLEIITLEGLGSADELHPLQAAFLEEQAAQCGFCTAGMIVAAQGLLNRVRYPDDDDIRAALDKNLCRCGVYDRVRRAIQMRIGRPHAETVYEVIQAEPVPNRVQDFGLPPSLRRTPQLDAWLRINEDGTLSIFSGKVELGQGIKTALAQIAAEELDVSLERIRVVTADTARSPDEGGTTGSRSVEASGAAIRLASAAARFHLLALAFEQLESRTPASDLQVKDGIISDRRTGRQTSYWDLMAGKRFERRVSGRAPVKDVSQHKVVGSPAKRRDLMSKVTGGAAYVHDMELPDMVHARVVRPPGYHARLIDFDMDRIRQMRGVIEVVRDGQFIALAAEGEEQAVRAWEEAREIARWEYEGWLPEQGAIYDDLLNQPVASQLVLDGVAVDEPIPDIHIPENAWHTLRASYRRPFQMHASLGPSAAAALWQDGRLTVWSHTQAAFNLQAALAQALGMDAAAVRVIHVEGSGCYGHNGADDVALDAALVARALPGRHIMMKWMRSDEHAWEPYGSAMALKLQASLSRGGMIVDWNHDIWSYSHSTRPVAGEESSGLLAAWHLARPFRRQASRPMAGWHSGSHRNADPIYDLARKRIVRHEAAVSPLRVSAMRGLGAYANIFAIESFMDELASAAGCDPLDFRLRHLSDERAKAVLLAAAARAGWGSRRESGEDGLGWGLALAQYKNIQCYVAVIVRLRVQRQDGAIRLERVIIAADAGQVVNPDGLSNQLEGGFVQAASWTLFEQVGFDEGGITSLDWETYPILTFKEAPVIETVILNRPELPALGAGEASQNPTPAAIANAVYDAVGIRLREIPLRPAKIKSLIS